MVGRAMRNALPQCSCCCPGWGPHSCSGV